MLYYIIVSIVSILTGFSAGYLVFDDKQVNLKQAKEICQHDSLCSMYVSCLLTNSRDGSGENLRNCDALLDAINYDKRFHVLQRAWEFCEKKEGRDGPALCREYVRPK